MRWPVALIAVLGCAGDPPELPYGAATSAAATSASSTSEVVSDDDTEAPSPSTSTSGGSAGSVTDPDPDSTSAGSDSTGAPEVPQSCQSGATTCDGRPGTVPDGQCNAFLQDCGGQQVCVPLGGLGGSTTCMNTFGSVAEGEMCSTKAPGFDNCAAGLICVQLDDTGHRCYPFCGCGPDYPTCADGTLCSLGASGTWGACGPPCDPLVNDCAFNSVLGDLGCFPAPLSGGFVCTQAVASDVESGSPCDTHHDCGAGQACVPSPSVATCNGMATCCVDLCDLADPAACGTGRSCSPWYDLPGPGCNENVGYCGFPQ